MKPYFILINGPMASGKSTVCKELEKELPVLFLDRAKIKDGMIKRLKRDNSQEGKQISKDTIYYLFKKVIPFKYNILMQEFELKSIKKHFDLKEFDVYVFNLTCSLETAKKRDIKRTDGKFKRTDLIEEFHAEHKDKKFEGIIINTEENSLKETIKIIKKEVLKE